MTRLSGIKRSEKAHASRIARSKKTSGDGVGEAEDITRPKTRLLRGVTVDSPAAFTQPLDAEELADFSKLETAVTEGLSGFWKAGDALRAIRDRRLYRASHDNFEDYCRKKWEISRAEAYRQIGAAEVIDNISASDSNLLLPTNLSQARPLILLKTAEQRQQAWGNVIKRTRGEGITISAQIVTEEVRKLKRTAPVVKKRKRPAKPTEIDPIAVGRALDEVRRAFGEAMPVTIRHAIRRIEEVSGFRRKKCAVFCDTKGTLGGLSNMASGHPLKVNGIGIRTVEALYQACRYPEHADIQNEIIAQKSPLIAKRIARGKLDKCRDDWDIIRAEIMRWCLKIKLLQHWDKFSHLLLSTKSLSIVEESAKDDFWGAIPLKENSGILKGRNVLGELLEDLREEIREGIILTEVKPPEIAGFLIAGRNCADGGVMIATKVP